jgi:hypothetical protein
MSELKQSQFHHNRPLLRNSETDADSDDGLLFFPGVAFAGPFSLMFYGGLVFCIKMFLASDRIP